MRPRWAIAACECAPYVSRVLCAEVKPVLPFLNFFCTAISFPLWTIFFPCEKSVSLPRTIPMPVSCCCQISSVSFFVSVLSAHLLLEKGACTENVHCFVCDLHLIKISFHFSLLCGKTQTDHKKKVPLFSYNPTSKAIIFSKTAHTIWMGNCFSYRLWILLQSGSNVPNQIKRCGWCLHCR